MTRRAGKRWLWALALLLLFLAAAWFTECSPPGSGRAAAI